MSPTGNKLLRLKEYSCDLKIRIKTGKEQEVL